VCSIFWNCLGISFLYSVPRTKAAVKQYELSSGSVVVNDLPELITH